MITIVSFSEPGQKEDPPPNTFCGDKSYYKYGDSCFKLDLTPKSYSSAQALCAADGGDLASIYDTYHEAFAEYLLYINGVTDAWIGMISNSVSMMVPVINDDIGVLGGGGGGGRRGRRGQ